MLTRVQLLDRERLGDLCMHTVSSDRFFSLSLSIGSFYLFFIVSVLG